MKKILRTLARSDSADSLAGTLRKKRFQLFLNLIPPQGSDPVSILDVGGWEKYWDIQNFTGSPHTVTILNLETIEILHPRFSFVQGDARDLSMFGNKSFDIVFSNSVIEHLGTYADQKKMADEVIRTGKKYYVQTPSFYFPLEPHFLFPMFHWFPVTVRTFLVMHFSLGWYNKCSTESEAKSLVGEIRLLTKSELRSLFPDADIRTERLMGFPKSYIAIKKD